MSEQKNKKSIFYQTDTLNEAQTDQEQLLAEIVTGKSWLILIAIYIGITFIILWGIFGSIPRYVEGKGILLPGKGSIFNATVPEGAIKIEKILVNAGEKIKAGQLLAILKAPGLKESVQTSKKYVNKLKQELKQNQIKAKQQLKKRKREIEKRHVILRRIINDNQENLKVISELMAIQKSSIKKGLETKQSLVATQQEYYRAKHNIENAKEELSKIEIILTDFENQWQDRAQDIKIKLMQAQHELSNTQSKLDLAERIYSPFAGIVSTIEVNHGDSVKEGEALITIASFKKVLQAVAFVSANEGKKINQGNTTYITPSLFKREEYGSIVGKVNYVSKYPLSEKSILAILQNKQLAKKLTENSAPILVKVSMSTDKNTTSGYRWTSSTGPNEKITAGTLVDLRTLVRKQRPISLLIPALKRMVGVY